MKQEDDLQNMTIGQLVEIEQQTHQLQKDGDYQKALIERGQSYLKQKDYPKAIQCFEKINQWETVADIYLTLGQEQKHNYYFAKYLLGENLIKEAADAFWKAGAFSEAAKLFENLYDFKKAMQAYVKADQINEAGEMLVRIGQPEKAARLFEKAGIYSQAVFYYQSIGKWNDLIRVYHLSKQYMDAIKVCLQHDQLSHACQLIHNIDKTHQNYLQAHILVFTYMIEHQHATQIPGLFYPLMYDRRATRNPKDLRTLAELLEKGKIHHEALHVYKRLIHMGDGTTSINARAEDLEQKLQYIKKKDTLHAYTNRFLLYRLIGQGAMSRVYKAQDSKDGEWVALKILSRDQEDTDHLQAFFQEAKASSYLQHPNIVKIFDYGLENDHLFISMEHLQGKTLQFVLKQMGSIALHDFLGIASQLCHALIYAHKMQIIHRDIKPSNIMLLPQKQVKLMDFGIAKLADMSNHISIQRGTPKYTSPEQILGVQTSKQSDIYSLGVVFYEMLAGKPPFEGETALHDHVNKVPVPLDQHVEGVPYMLVNMIMSCLAKNPNTGLLASKKS
ncbi:MAG: protein kinase [Bdellovibrionota bacterium]